MTKKPKSKHQSPNLDIGVWILVFKKTRVTGLPGKRGRKRGVPKRSGSYNFRWFPDVRPLRN
jgi:hypothetical protein